MKVADYIVQLITSKKIKKVFAITGGASIHLIHSIAENKKIDYICMHHEQACGMAADGYSRATDDIGIALATSGPGATNLITAICCSWFDSIPVIFITGQVTRFRMKGKLGVRQIGFQETDIISMVKSVTKYSTQIKNITELKTKFEKAFYYAKADRPGPVLIDIPDDIQREIINNKLLNKFNNSKILNFYKPKKNINLNNLKKIKNIFTLLSNSNRPVMIIGSGVRLSNSEKLIKYIQKKLNIPVAPTWATQDMWSSDSDYFVRSFGTHGTRAGNFIVQNSDLILSIGARLGTRETGSPLTSFAKKAKIALIDIDLNEIKKFKKYGKKIDISINIDARFFAKEFIKLLNLNLFKTKYTNWYKYIANIKKKYPVVTSKTSGKKFVNPYLFFNQLSGYLSDNELIFVDTGSTIAWIMQSFKFNSKTRVIHDFNNTAMGYALPAAIGGKVANNKKSITCIVGEGSLMMNIQELATLDQYKLSMNIIIINNNGYSMVKQTQDQWLDSKYYATSSKGGISFPNFKKIAESFNLNYLKINNNDEISNVMKKKLNKKKSRIIEIFVDPNERVNPQSRFGFPIEDSDPILPRKEFFSNMLND